ncbi:MAG: T9SS type A sorting domain-containing protein [Bacteroidetes bacterium]|nr:T9SS type A sorting domain-containing protein [Bacteroidota bacterium]
MKKIILIICINLLILQAFCQTAPTHLKYFGFALVDMLWDDPHDASTITNYIAEVNSFSNIAQLGVYDYTDNIIARVNLMNSKCVKPIVSFQSIFYQTIDTIAPSGNHIALFTNYVARWNFFKTVNATILNSSKIGAFYVVDEPVWNGLSFYEFNAVCDMIKTDFPNIPLFFVEAKPALSSLKIPTTIDWIAFDDYGIFNPLTSISYNNDMDTLKSKRSNPNQKIVLVIDDQWMPYYGAAGYSPDTIRYMVQNYYNLAASDTEIIGMIGYLWPGGLDDPGQLGVRDMPQSVINKNVEIGTMIKANYSPCSTTGLTDFSNVSSQFNIYPNPGNDKLFISLYNSDETEIKIFNVFGQEVFKQTLTSPQTIEINIEHLQSGVYCARAITDKNIIYDRTLIIRK